ncbi:MAG: molybdate-binding protein [Microbacteriaceae bacterium]|nr:molybdate-binding protein [Microbacteriaceae bacterium]
MRKIAAVLISATVLLGATACSAPTPAATKTSSTGVTGSIIVYAAASLQATFTQLASDFEDANPGTFVTLSFGGSSDLAAQIIAGAPADVFASADTKNMDKIGARAVTPTNFATNVLEIAVPPSNPASIKTLADLAKAGVKTVVCAPQVPCGAAALGVEQAAGVTISPVSQESSVTDVLGKVVAGEADAGLVYVTDVKGAGKKVKGITFPESAKVVNTYPIASLSSSKDGVLAKAFADYVAGPKGLAVLKAAGFGTP